VVWLAELPFDAEDLADIISAVDRRRASIAKQSYQAVPANKAGNALSRPLGAGWLEWRWIRKTSGREYGPYVYYRWRDAGRKRTKYVGKVTG
jgi:hypothetical protein